MDAKKIGERLSNLRKNKSQERVANEVGISVSALSMYEQGNRVPRDEIKVKLAAYFGVTVEELFFKE
jgi:transcriptional regulator with XRE-family HTH domain